MALVGTSVFYQMRYNDMKSGYERSFEDINHTLKDLTTRQKDMYYNISELNVSVSREIALAQKLGTKTLEFEDLSRELSLIQQQLFECQKNSDMLYVNSTFSNELLAKHAASVVRLQKTIETLKTDVEKDAQKSVILEDIKNIQIELDTLRNY